MDTQAAEVKLSRQQEAVFSLEKEAGELRAAVAKAAKEAEDAEEGGLKASFKGFGKPFAGGGSTDKQLSAMKQAVRTAQVCAGVCVAVCGICTSACTCIWFRRTARGQWWY